MTADPEVLPTPSQGEIWAVKIPTDPPERGLRYVVVVSSDAQNHHPRAQTVMVVPLSTTLSESDRLQLSPGETGLQEKSEVWANGMTTISKRSLKPPRIPLRKLSRSTVCRIVERMVLAIGIHPDEIF
jgi:mRNA-degrading endonuclease toxin of MazEF toxin-antitoxin module